MLPGNNDQVRRMNRAARNPGRLLEKFQNKQDQGSKKGNKGKWH
jgi:hypothetical protein|tara:strand:+ start:186 stop:317 length:132 start_codon:yes stop_codon:yes gene_type:complete